MKTKKNLTPLLCLFALNLMLSSCSMLRENGIATRLYSDRTIIKKEAVAIQTPPIATPAKPTTATENALKSTLPEITPIQQNAPAPVASYKQNKKEVIKRIAQKIREPKQTPVVASRVKEKQSMFSVGQFEERTLSAQSTSRNDTSILLIILAILIPPLAVAFVDGIHGSFWLNILLCLLFLIPGIIHALIVVTR